MEYYNYLLYHLSFCDASFFLNITSFYPTSTTCKVGHADCLLNGCLCCFLFGLGRGGLRAYALTSPLLGFSYEIESRDMNEKGNGFIFYNKPYMPSAGLHGPLHMARCVHSVSPCSYPSARSACTHTVVLPLHQIINYVKDKIGVVFLRSCVIFDTL